MPAPDTIALLQTSTSFFSFPEIPYVRVFHLPDRQEELSVYGGHSCFKILFIEENEGWYQIGHRKIWAMPGDLFLLTPDEVHNPSGLKGTKNWCVVFEADVFALNHPNADTFLMLPDELLLLSFLVASGIATGYSRIDLSARPQWLARLRQLKHELRDKPFGLSETAYVLLMLLLTDTVRLVAPELRQQSLRSRSLLVSVFRFIKTYYHQQISLCDVARRVDRSSAYLTDFVRRETGRTVLSWIIECRIAEARRLLLVTNQSIQQIAEAVGYLDTGHFIRQFRRLNGMTPQAWRQANQSLVK